MVEAVSATTEFNLPVDEILEEAFDILKGEYTNGYDMRSARRSLNLLMIDLANREYPLAHLEKNSVSLVQDQAEYTLDADIIGILDVNFKTSDGTEIQMYPTSLFDYFNIPTKSTDGKPNTYAFDRTVSPSKLIVWPVPDSDAASGTIEYWGMRRHKDVTKSYQLVDMNYRYLPALSMGLAYFMSFKKEGIEAEKVAAIFQEYEARLDRAFLEDRERTDFWVYPDIPR
jgi:hypothetical protein